MVREPESSKAGLKPATDASPPRILYRRLSFGLTGLPPDPAQATKFEREFSPVRGSLLNHAEELMTYYSLRGTFREALAGRRGAMPTPPVLPTTPPVPMLGRYRDYVVRSFNQDKPYDRFVKEQVAGDEMDPDNPENLVATGFLRMGPWEQTGMGVFKETRQMWLDDVTDSVGQTPSPTPCNAPNVMTISSIPSRPATIIME